MWQDLARAKVNLCLHVTGHRADGLHELESLVVFPDIADRLTLEKFDELRLTLDGPFGAELSGDNLILDVARMMGVTGHFNLTKNLPVASGVGGGSADAAAAIRLIATAFNMPMPDTAATMRLGADIPVCLQSSAAIMSGAGERVQPVDLPSFGIVLVNAGRPVSTADVFSRLTSKSNPPLDDISMVRTAANLFEFLFNQRNDLELSAIQSCPIIAEVLAAIGVDPTCALARMSGSGGTCFGMFENADLAKNAADKLRAAHPDWWIAEA